MQQDKKRRLAELEARADQACRGIAVFREDEQGLYVSGATGDAYSEAQLRALIEARPEMAFVVGGNGMDIPPDPRHAPPAMSVSDIALWNADVDGADLDPEQRERLKGIKRAMDERLSAYATYEAAYEPFADEMERRNTALGKKRGGN